MKDTESRFSRQTVKADLGLHIRKLQLHFNREIPHRKGLNLIKIRETDTSVRRDVTWAGLWREPSGTLFTLIFFGSEIFIRKVGALNLSGYIFGGKPTFSEYKSG